MTHLLRHYICPILLLIALVCPSVSGQIAVVVHPDNPIEDIDLVDLKRIYLGKITTFESGTPIVLTENVKFHDEFYETVTDMTLRRFRKHWMKIVFEGVYATPPIAFKKQPELKEFLGQNPGTIGFIDIIAIDSTLKVLTVEGLDPEADGYPLRNDKLTGETE